MKTIIQATRQELYESPVVKQLQSDQASIICHSADGTLDEVNIIDPFLDDDIN